MTNVAFNGGMRAISAPAVESVPSQFVTFTCGTRAFGVDIMSVREIRSWSPTTELPNQPFGAKGVLDIRGSIVQVFDLEVMLGGSQLSRESHLGQVVLVVSLANEDVGMLVDAVSDIIFAKPDDLRPVPKASADGAGGMVSSLVKNEDRLIGVLNLDALFPQRAN